MLKRRDRSRDLVLEAADQAFRTLGFDQTSMDEIAKGAGLTRKTVYNLFASKEDIALELIARVEAGDAGYRQRMMAGDDAVAVLEQVLLDSARWCLANPSLAQLALSPAARPSLAPPPDRPSFQRLVRDIVILGQRQDIIRDDEDPGFMALVLLGIFGQAMLSALPTGSFGEPDIRRIIGIVIEGIGRHKGPGR